MEADALGPATGDEAKVGRVAEHAGIGAESAAERSELYEGHERRGEVDVERFEPHACGWPAGAARGVNSIQLSVES